MPKYARTLDELKGKAVLHWPNELIEREASISVLPLLLKTQDKFISILNLSDSSPDSWKKFVDVSEVKGNLFLKHLMVLSDLGGEALNKYPPFSVYFPDGRMNYVWREKNYEYELKVIQNDVSLTNSALRVDGKRLIVGFPLDAKMEDVIMLLLHGGSSVGDTLPESFKNKCEIGTLIGDPEELEKFVKQSYIRISRQIGGATANSLGQIAQDFVIEKLREILPTWEFNRNGTLPGVSHTGGRTETNFDVIGKSPNDRYFGIEVSFQFTTNSTIERKAGQAQARQALVHDAGHRICYVIDGAGNINIREAAVRTICRYSDCTIALSTEEIRVLANFMEEQAGA
ncbi:MAG TPA: hypothetical protein VNO50_06270 [Pyrinomonadaceae bacterium]|nr:hypothetical protein [Pyrinomonadaceae bacterium]